jgi:hypothetical protein
MKKSRPVLPKEKGEMRDRSPSPQNNECGTAECAIDPVLFEE